MSYLADLAQDIAAAEAVQALGRSDGPVMPAPSASVADGARALAVLDAEIMQVSALIAVVSSVFNALERRSYAHIDPRVVVAFIPAHSAAFAAAPDVAREACDLPQLLALHSYLARFSFAERLTRAALVPGGALTDDVELIADAWRRTCVAALEVEALFAAVEVDDIGNAVFRAERDSRARSTARALLEAAALGGWPCLDLDGRVTVPGWAERRRSPRVVVSQLVTVVVHGVASVGRLVDVSRDGMQIAAAATVSCGDAIEVVLADQRRAVGQVRWAQGGRIGVQLNGPFNF
ncbi:MAG: hypothetical protein HOO99_06450 [Hyphomicrobiaceae bacterium]|nr:hypothetical protein [Hyphomicrobiaceae bacterium]